MARLPRKLGQINGHVLSRVGPLPYETDADKDELNLISNIIDHALKQKHIIFYKGQTEPQWGQEATLKEQQSWHYALQHISLNQPKEEVKAKPTIKIQEIKEEPLEEKKVWWERFFAWLFKGKDY